jgi:hypothetical protein
MLTGPHPPPSRPPVIDTGGGTSTVEGEEALADHAPATASSAIDTQPQEPLEIVLPARCVLEPVSCLILAAQLVVVPDG